MADPTIDIRYVANLARINLTDDEVTRFSGQLQGVMKHIDKLSEVDVEGIEPTAHASPVFDVMREDVARPGFGVENALKNAPRRVGDQFGVPKVIE